MRSSKYLFNPGRMERRDHTLKFTPVDAEGREGAPKFIPVEQVDDLYVFGSLQANSALFNFLGKQRINVHFFDYYEHYTGSFMAKDYLLAGKMQVEQTSHYLSVAKRLTLARSILDGASFNILKNLRYYANRDRDLDDVMGEIVALQGELVKCADFGELMGIEGNIRKAYYRGFDEIITGFEMGGREKQPPSNEVNALVSFGNMMCYTLCLGMIYHTQLNPTISFLHEPGTRRYSLALDLAEIFKPLLVDRTIFKVLNKGMLGKSDFEQRADGCFLKDKGRKVFAKAWDERLKETIQHRSLGRKVMYKNLVKLEAYKISKHCLGIQQYEPFKMWW